MHGLPTLSGAQDMQSIAGYMLVGSSDTPSTRSLVPWALEYINLKKNIFY